jgi:nitrite reductase (NADH) small subunit
MDNSNETKPLVFNLGSVDRIPAGQGLSYVVCGHEIAVFRQRDDHVFATQNRCPHKQGSLAEGILGGGKIICPLHSFKYDLCNGKGIDNDYCLKTFPVRVENGEVLLSLEPSFFSQSAKAKDSPSTISLTIH